MKNVLKILYLITFIKVIFGSDPIIITAFDQIDPESSETSTASNESDLKSQAEYFERLGITNHLKNLWSIDPDIAEDSLLTTVSKHICEICCTHWLLKQIYFSA